MRAREVSCGSLIALGFSLLSICELVACAPAPAPAFLDSTSGDVLLSSSAARIVRARRPDHRTSWFSPDIKKSTTLLFVSDAGTGDVYLYNVPSLKVAGRVSGFAQPQGECSNARGDVWVTDTNAQVIYELSHTGRLVNTLTDTGGYPIACAWDPHKGNLAVMNIFGFRSAGGSVLIYPHASGTPVAFTNPTEYLYYFGAFDGKGNLFFDGIANNGTFMLSELVKDTTVNTVKVTGGTIYFPGMVQWDGNNLLVGDQSCENGNSSCIYQLAVGTNSAAIENEIQLQDAGGKPVCDLVQGVATANEIAGSDNDFCGNEANGTYLWSYPSGGAPTNTNLSVDALPVGAALSITKR